jgi:hypothetical protein
MSTYSYSSQIKYSPKRMPELGLSDGENTGTVSVVRNNVLFLETQHHHHYLRSLLRTL